MIYLSNYKDRYINTLNHLQSHGIIPNLFRGIDAINLKLYTKCEKNEDLKKFTPGRIGCFLSHYMLWNHLYHSKIEETIIFEDDVRLDNDFINKFTEYKKQLPNDWQYVFLGYQWLDKCIEQYYSTNILIGRPYCTHAYMIKYNVLETLLENCNEFVSYLDIQIQRKILPYIKYYVYFPPLVNQMSLECNNGGKYKSLCDDWEFGL